MKKIVLCFLMLFSSLSFSMDTAGYFKISKIWTWGAWANGVILIQLESQNALCPNGYWFQDSQGGASRNLLGVALSAYHAKSPVMIYANENSDYAGLSAKECEVQLIVLGS